MAAASVVRRNDPWLLSNGLTARSEKRKGQVQRPAPPKNMVGLPEGSPYWLWPAPSPSLDAAPSVSPGRPPVDVSVTVRAFMRLEPFLAIEPTTVTSSPILSVSRRQPRRCRPCGGPISAPQL